MAFWQQMLMPYDEFGLPAFTNDYSAQPFGYTGYQMDEISGLYFAQARRYDPRAGRFVSEDLVKGFSEAPFTLNPYIYCWNRPEDFEDNDGELPTVVIGALVGGGVSAVLEIGSQIASDVKDGKEISIDWNKVGIEAVKGTVKGAIAGTGAGLLVTAASNGVIDGVGNAIEQKLIDGKANIDVGEAVETGIWSAGTTIAFAGIDKVVGNIKDKIGVDKVVNTIKDKIGINKLKEALHLSSEKIKLRENRSLSDIIHGRNTQHTPVYSTVLNDLNNRVGKLKASVALDEIRGNTYKNAINRAAEYARRRPELREMIWTYTEQKLVGGVKGKIKGGLRNSLYLSNLKEDVDIAGHVNEFICAFA